MVYQGETVDLPALEEGDRRSGGAYREPVQNLSRKRTLCEKLQVRINVVQHAHALVRVRT